MNTPKLILLYGFASSGKTTLSKKYTDEHPLSMAFEGDQIISMMGGWREQEDKARRLVFEHTKSIVKNQLEAGYDVLLPYLLTEPKDAEVFENIAQEIEVPFFEVYLDIERKQAIERLLKRGCWGEEGSPKLTEDDMGEINDLYDTMETAMKERPNVTSIKSVEDAIEETYQLFLRTLPGHAPIHVDEQHWAILEITKKTKPKSVTEDTATKSATTVTHIPVEDITPKSDKATKDATTKHITIEDATDENSSPEDTAVRDTEDVVNKNATTEDTATKEDVAEEKTTESGTDENKVKAKKRLLKLPHIQHSWFLNTKKSIQARSIESFFFESKD